MPSIPRLKNFIKKHIKLVSFVVITLFFAASVIIRISDFNQSNDIQNIDASYHVLLTMNAIDQAGIKSSSLLPLVSLTTDSAGPAVPWGATVKGNDGLFYYTSFPQIGFALPSIIFDYGHIPVTLFNLMLFNMLVGYISVILLFVICFLIARSLTKNEIKAHLLALTVSILAMFSIEVMFSQGVIYWGQSLMQPILLSQLIIVFALLQQKKKSTLLVILLALVILLGIMTEWTGYFSALGILLLCIVKAAKDKQWRQYAPLVISVLVGGIIGTLLFVTPFIVKLSAPLFVETSMSRFIVRDSTNQDAPGLIAMLGSYVDSFGPFIIATLFVLAVALAHPPTRTALFTSLRRHAGLLFIATFPLLENVLLRQHAYEYSFDRLKFVIPLSMFLVIILASLKTRRTLLIALGAISIAIAVSLTQYTHSQRTAVTPGYTDTSEILSYTKEAYPNATYLFNGPVRGWLNNATGKNIIEQVQSYKSFRDNCTVGICVWLIGTATDNSMYIVRGALVFDSSQNKLTTIGTPSFDGLLYVDEDLRERLEQTKSSTLKQDYLLKEFKQSI